MAMERRISVLIYLFATIITTSSAFFSTFDNLSGFDKRSHPLRMVLSWSQNEKQDNLGQLAHAVNYLQGAKMIVFDKDGTLGDDAASLSRWAIHMTGRLKEHLLADAAVNEFHTTIGWDAANGSVTPSAPLAAGTWQEQVETLAQLLKENNMDPSLAQLWHGQVELHGADAPLISNLREMLLDCSKEDLQLAICTSDERESTDRALKSWKVDDIMDGIICGDEVDEKSKPRAYPLEKLCALNEHDTVTPQHCIVVGDTISDSGMAKNANALLCIGVLTGSGTAEILYETGANVIVPDVGHVPALLRALKAQK